MYFEPDCGRLLAEFVDVEGKLALEIGGFVFRDMFFSCEFVEHLCDNDELGGCFGGVGHLAQIAHCVASCLCIVAVAKTAGFCLADSLDGRFMICHLWNRFFIYRLVFRSSP